MRDYRSRFPGEPVACLRVSKRKSDLGRKLVDHCNNLSPKEDAKKRRKLSSAAKAQWADPKLRKKTIKAQTEGKLSSQKFKESHQKAIAVARATPGRKEKAAKGAKKFLKEKWQDPEWKKKQRERLSLLQTERMHQGINKWTNHHTNRKNCIYEGPNGPITMRSSWEVKFANDLDAMEADWEYEPDHFPYNYDGITKHYTPDFYVWELDSYVEIKPESFLDEQLDAKILGVAKAHNRILILSEDAWPFEDDSPLIASLEQLELLCR